MLIAYSLVLCVVVLLVKWLVEKRAFYKKLEHIKGPRPLPVLGNLLDFLSPTAILPNLERFHKENGNVYKISLGPIYTYVVILDCDIIEAVLTSNRALDKSNDYSLLHDWLGQGILTAPGNIWKQYRKIITPAFHFQILDKMVDGFEKPVSVLVDKFKEECESGATQTDVYKFVTLYTLDVLCETAMGYVSDVQIKADSKFADATRRMLNIFRDRMFSVYKQFEFLFRLTPSYWTQTDMLKILHGTSRQCLTNRKLELAGRVAESKVEQDEFGIKSRKAFLDLLLEFKASGQPISDEIIQNNLDTFLFAGHDTTASSISFTLYLLSNHPDVQQKVYSEAAAILKESGGKLGCNELNELKYLELVIKESLRLYPSVPLFGRMNSEDSEYGGLFVPKGVTLTISPYLLHRRADIFPEPDKFIPERFLAQNQAKRHPFGYIPFSAGQRNCIGQKFAMMSMKSAIAKVVNNFELLPVDKKIELSYEVVLKSTSGVYVKLKKR